MSKPISSENSVLVSGYRIRWSLRQRTDRDGEWILDYYLPGGQRRRISTRTRDHDAALVKVKEYLKSPDGLAADVQRAVTRQKDEPKAQGGDPRISEVSEYYLDTALTVRNARPRSRERAVPILRDFEMWCRMKRIGRVSQLSRRTVDEWAAALAQTQAPATVKLSLTTLRAALNAAVEGGLMEKSPITKWLMPVVDPPVIRALTLDQVRDRLEAVRKMAPEHYPPIAWIAHTGNRAGEVRLLRWSQIDLKTQTIERPQKSRHLARYQFSDQARAVLRLVEGKHKDLVFPNPETGEVYEKKFLLRVWQRCQQRAGLQPVANLYDLRDSFASNMANIVGCPLPILQSLMGHKSIDMTMKYVKPGNAADWLRTYGKTLKIADPNGHQGRKRP